LRGGRNVADADPRRSGYGTARASLRYLNVSFPECPE
jgi:hypothetical protein